MLGLWVTQRALSSSTLGKILLALKYKTEKGHDLQKIEALREFTGWEGMGGLPLKKSYW